MTIANLTVLTDEDNLSASLENVMDLLRRSGVVGASLDWQVLSCENSRRPAGDMVSTDAHRRAFMRPWYFTYQGRFIGKLEDVQRTDLV